jgi:hypothetical protein
VFDLLCGIFFGGLFSVLVGVMFARFRRVMRGMGGVTVRDMSVVSCLFVVASLMMIGGGVVMRGSVLMVFGSFAVVIDSLLRHGEPLSEIQRTSLEG